MKLWLPNILWRSKTGGALAVGSGEVLGRWLTYDEVVELMASSPLVARMLWECHKNNPRQTLLPHPALYALEKVSSLRRSIRWAELQMVRLRLAVAQNDHNLHPSVCWMLQKFLAYTNRSNDKSSRMAGGDDAGAQKGESK
jgi:hypothetical protein